MTKEEATFIAAGLIVIAAALAEGDVSREKQIAVSELIKDSAIMIGKGHGVSSTDMLLALSSTLGEMQ